MKPSLQSTELTPKGRATRERIVAAASAEIFERGVARTSLDEVKAAAGVSSSQLYHYFADKHALVLAVIEHQSEAIIAAQQPLLGNLDSLPALRAWRDLIVGIQNGLGCRGGCPIGSIGSELAETDPEARTFVAAGLNRWQGAIEQGLRTMRDRGELRAEAHPEELSLALFAALQGGFLLTQVERDTRPLEVALDTMLDHIASLLATPSAA